MSNISVEYELFANDEDSKDERLHVKILSGDFAGVVVAFDILKLLGPKEDDNLAEEGRCTYNIEVVEEPAPGMVNPILYNICDAILTNVFEDIAQNYEDIV